MFHKIILCSASLLCGAFAFLKGTTMESGTTRVLSFFGPPGSGKGTVAQRLVKDLGYCMLSTGDLARSHIQDQTELGKAMQVYVGKGELIPDKIITQMVLDWLQEKIKTCSTIILDGFPRTSGQAECLLRELQENKAFSNSTFSVVNFELPEEEIVRRISSRSVCENKKCQEVYSELVKKPKVPGICDICESKVLRRSDDEPEVVRERLRGFAKTKDSLLSAYAQADQEVADFVVPEGGLDVVFQEFLKNAM
jgi:adenylate kinase